jgi:hypothetical protein
LIRYARLSVCEGLSPNAFRYSTEKRPSSAKPKHVAISVTFVSLQSADKRACLARDSRNIRRRRHGGSPCTLWNALRSVRSLTPIMWHRAETWSGSSTLARAKTSACLTRSRRDFRPRVEEVSATAAIHRSIATEQTYALRESTSHQTTQGCVQAILSFGAIGSFNGYLWPENARPKKVETIILSARQSRRLRQTIGRSASASPYGGEP